MAAGLPIVTTNLPEAAKYADVILWSQNEAEFMANIHRAPFGDTPERGERRLAVAWENSWLVRAGS